MNAMLAKLESFRDDKSVNRANKALNNAAASHNNSNKAASNTGTNPVQRSQSKTTKTQATRGARQTSTVRSRR